MSSEINWNPLLADSVWGSVRGLAVVSATYPLDVIKTRQQVNPQAIPVSRVARTIFDQEGVPGFFRGFSPHCVRSIMRQAWSWPMLMGLPGYLQRSDKTHVVGPYMAQGLAGVSIAAVDTVVTTPLEKARITYIASRQAYRETLHYQSLNQFIRRGWSGAGTQFLRGAVAWSTFLSAQQYFRDQLRRSRQKEELNLAELCAVGATVALTVGVSVAPFDFRNTLSQSSMHLPYKLGIRGYYRGMPVNALGLVIHNVASVILIDYLSQSRKNARA